MIVEGRYSITAWDNPLAPFVEALVRTTDGKWVKVLFLIDLGADGTYLPSKYLKTIGIQLDEAETQDDVTGVGGQSIEHIPFPTQLRFINDSGDQRTVDLEIGIFVQEESLDLPLLGRDVMNLFTFLCDMPANLVWLIDEAERTEILEFCDAVVQT